MLEQRMEHRNRRAKLIYPEENRMGEVYGSSTDQWSNIILEENKWVLKQQPERPRTTVDQNIPILDQQMQDENRERKYVCRSSQNKANNKIVQVNKSVLGQ